MIYKRTPGSGLALESTGFGGGRINKSSNGYEVNYQITDHLGSVRVVFRDKNDVLARNDYYAFGKPHVNSDLPASDDSRNRFLFNGKEKQLTGDLRFLDYGARMYDTEIGRWFNPDPLAEKYYSWSPYNYALDNPVRFIDPDGLDVNISGNLSEEAIKQLQAMMKDRITLSRGDNGKVSYTINEGKKLRGNAKRMAKMIDNHDIKVNIKTTDKMTTSTGHILIGGAFMGNTVNADGTAVANQEVNPTVLSKMDGEDVGKNMMHEVTEAYAGAQISQKAGVVGTVGLARQADENNPNSLYRQAHDAATPQTPLREEKYDGNRRVSDIEAQKYPLSVRRREYYVRRGGKDIHIHTWRMGR